jgi:ketosteroid isomerase-like protein
MSIDQNKALILELFERFSASDVDGAMRLLADDATWWISGKPDRLPSAGTHDKARFERLLRGMLAAMPGGLALTVTAMTAEGDRVAAEVVSSGDLKDGRQYRQEYHFLLRIRDGRIHEVREYLDTQHARDIWARP